MIAFDEVTKQLPRESQPKRQRAQRPWHIASVIRHCALNNPVQWQPTHRVASVQRARRAPILDLWKIVVSATNSVSMSTVGFVVVHNRKLKITQEVVRSKRWATRRAHEETVITLVDGEILCAHFTKTENQVKCRQSNMCRTREGVFEGQTTSVEELRDIRENNMILLLFPVQTELGQPRFSVAAENNENGRECLLGVPDRRHQFFPKAGTAWSVHATMRSIERANTDPPRHQSPFYSQGVGKAWNAGSSDCLVKQNPASLPPESQGPS